MTVKSTFIIMAFATAILGSLQTTNAQNTSPFWSLAGNNNATASSKLGTTNAIPVRLMTNNRTRVFIDASGKVGIGTTAPAFSLDVQSNILAYGANVKGINQSGVLRLQNTNVSGWSAADFFDNVGTLKAGVGFGNATVAGPFGSKAYLTSIGTDPLVLGTNNSIRLFVDGNNGNIGIGTTVPIGRLDLGNPGNNVGLFIVKSGFSTAAEFTKNSTTSVTQTVAVNNNGPGDAITGFSNNGNGIVAGTNSPSQFAGFFSGNVFTTGSYQSSDEKLKENIRDFSSAMSIIGELHPKLYQFKKDGNYALMNLPQGDHYGLIAQEVEKVLPNLVKETKFDTRLKKPGVDREKPSPSDVVDFKTLNYTELIPIIIKAVQELSKQNEDLQKQVNELKATPWTGIQASPAISLTNASLEQNIPNPFNHNTTVNYFLPEKFSNAQIIVNDKTGKVLKQINISGTGKGAVNIDASTLSGGVYSYSLIVDGKLIGTKQMILSK